MKRNELLRRSKKIFAAVLTAAMVTNSVVPGSLVLASDDGIETETEAAAEIQESADPSAEPAVLAEENEETPAAQDVEESDSETSETPAEAAEEPEASAEDETTEPAETPEQAEAETPTEGAAETPEVTEVPEVTENPETTEIPTEETEDAEKTCTCTEKCTSDKINTECEVCGAQDADLETCCEGEEKQDVAFDQSQTVDGIEVTVSADEGVFPEGASLNVRKVENQSVLDTFENAVDAQQETSSEDALMEEIRTELEKLADQGMDDFGVETGEENELKVFDITVTDENGTEIQPDTSKGTTTVSFAGIDTDSSTEEIQVYHANEDLGSIQALDTAADVDAGYAEVTAEHFSYYCLSTWTGSTSLAINQLTGSETNLNTGIYYLKNDLTYNEDKSRKNGLAIGANQTVYLYIPEGTTLTVYGQDGTDATNGGNGTEGQFSASSSFTQYGVTAKENPGKATTTKGATGGTGATGGGAAIYVPSSAKLVVLGSGTLNATGGNGGKASDGGTGGATNYLYFTAHYAYRKNQMISGTEYWTVSKASIKTNMNNTSGSCTGDPLSWFTRRASVGTGGAGGGGAAGGGAGIGSNGADGKSGVSSANANTANANSYNKISATDTAKNSTSVNTATNSGTVYISGVHINSIGGTGGSAGKTATTESTKTNSFKGWSSSTSLKTFKVWYANGQAGGGGAAGGNGASVGAGGQGGAGGMAGDSGSLITNCASQSSTNSTSKLTSIPSAGKNGVSGSNGTGSGKDLSDDQNPYNTVTFTGASSDGTQKYYLAKESTITVPSSNVSGFFGWRVTTGAETLDASFGERTTNSLLAGDTRIYKAGETITVDKLANGNVVLEAVIHSHSWKYESNGNEIKVYCAGENGEGVCDHYGSENAVTLTLKADSKTYDGTAVSASVENTDVVKEMTGVAVDSVIFYKADADGNITDKENLSEAPKDAGSYLAVVTAGSGRAEQKFTISPFEIKEENVALDHDSFEWTGTELSPAVTVQVTLKDGEQTLTADKDYTLTGTLAATDLSGTEGYTLTVSGTGNFTGSVDKTWKITKKVMAGISASPVETTYDGTSHGITVTGQPDGAEITYSADGKNYSTEQPVCKDVKAGGYTVYYKVTKDGYEDYTGSATVMINPRPITVKVADKTITYGDAEPEYTSQITEGTLVDGDDLELTYSRDEGTAAKTYAITAAGANSNYKVEIVPGTLTIQKKDLTIIPEAGQKKVYGAPDPQLKYSVNGLVNGEKAEDILKGVLARIEGKNKGTYAYEIGNLEDTSGNYQVILDEKAAEFEITAREVTLNWSKTDLTYNGSEQSVTAQVSNLAFDTDTFALEYTGNSATDAGNYKAEVTALGNDNYVLTENSNQKTDWSIAKAETQFNAPEIIPNLTYTGEAQNLILTGQTKNGKFIYKVNGGKWSETIPSGLDAGTYEISYKVVGDDNHNDSAEVQLIVTIAKKAVVVSGITAEDKTYDGNTSAVLNYDGVKFDGLLEKDSLSVSAEGTFEDKNAGTAGDESTGSKKVLISNLALDGASVQNYVLAKDGQQSETTAAIKAKEINAVITPNGGTYEGTITPATAVLNGLVGEDKPEITLTYTGKANDGTEVGSDGNGSTEAPTHAGTYTVTASITDGNYSLKAEGASAQFVVAKADPALSVSAVADKNYGEEAFQLETSNKGDGQKSYTSSDEKVVAVDENGLVTIVGAGKATLTVSLAESANYTAEEKTVTVTVKKVDHKLVVEKLAYEVTYGDPTFKIAASAGDQETDIKFASNDKDVASVSADGTVTVGKVGTAKITVSMDESQNYLAVAKEVKVTVVPKEVTITPNDASKVYGDKDGDLSYRADGLVGKDTLSGITLVRAEGEDVGNYDITASEKKDANPNYSVKFNKGTFTITQKEIVLNWTDTKLTYNGKDQQPKAEAAGLVGDDTCEVTVTGAQKNANAAAGSESYTATAVKLSNPNYKLPAETTAQYTIEAKEIGIEWSNVEGTYDGTKKLPTAKATGLVEGDTCGITVSGATTEAGTHTAKAEAVDNLNYKLPKDAETSFVINKAETSISQTPEMISELTYTGEAQNLVNAGQTADGKFVYKVNDGEWSENLPSGLDAGTYEISYKVIGDDNHNDSVERKLTVTIAKKAVVVSGITAEDKTYDGNTVATLNFDGVKFDGLLEKDSLSIVATGTFEDKNAGTTGDESTGSKKVLISNLTLDGASVQNYVLAKDGQQAETTAAIKAKEITAVITPNGGTYEGTITPATAILNGLVGEDKPEITLTYSGTAYDGTVSGSEDADSKATGTTTVPTHAGVYTVTASITDSNYSLKAEGASAQFVVAKADPALSVSAVADKNYGEEAFKLESTNKGDGAKSYTTSDENVVTVDENGLVTIVGAGKATLTVSLAESANYTAEEKTVTVTVKKVDHKLVVEKLAYEVTYGDPAFKIAASAGDKETDIKFASNDKDVASVSKDGTVTVGNVGTAKIKVSMDESQNYLAVAKEVTVTVVPKEVTVTPNDASKVYGDKDGDLSYRANGLVGDDTLSDITLARADGEDVGTYDITASEKKDANPNYSVKFNKGTFTITQKEIGLTWTDTKLTYNGKDQQPKAEATGLVGDDTCEVTVTGAQKNANAAAGSESYTATAVKLSNPNYKLPAETTAQYTIEAKEIGIQWDNLETTYDGKEKLPTATATGLAEGDSCTLTVIMEQTEAGTHTAKVVAADNKNYKLPAKSTVKFVIRKAESTISQAPEVISGLTYNGEAQELVNAGKTADGTFAYKVNDGDWSENLPSGMDAGTYTISYKVIGDSNHEDSKEGSLTIAIAKKAVVVSGIMAEDKTYDGNTSAALNYAGVKFDGLLEKDSLRVTAVGAFEDKNAGQKKVLVSGLTLGGASVKNYVLAAKGQQSETEAAITAKEITAVITPNGGIYEGTITPATAVLNGLIGEDKPEITLTYSGTAYDGTVAGSENAGEDADSTNGTDDKAAGTTEVPAHAGIYTVTASITDGNYSLRAEGASAEFVVAKADPALTVSAVADKSYGEEAFKLESTNKGDGQKSYASSDEKVVTVDENGLVTIVGAGKAALTVSLAENANYTASVKTVTVTVNKTDHSLVVDQLAYEAVYGDPAFSVAPKTGDAEASVKYASSNENVASVDENGVVTIKIAGEATITLEMEESGNYNAATKTVTLNILPKAVTVTPDAMTKVYEEADPELTYKADGLVGEDTLADITLARAEGENAGTYDITAAAKEGSNPNYSINCNKGTFTITPKSIDTAQVTLGDALKYTGEELTQTVTKVTLDGKELPADAYTVENNTATEAGTYTLTVKVNADSNYTGTLTWTFVVAPANEEQITETPDGDVKIGTGTLSLAVRTESGAPATTLGTSRAEIIDMLIQSGDISADELAEIANGATVDIVLTVKDGSATVSADSKAQMESSSGDYTVGQYLDISLFKYMTVNGKTDEGEQLHETAGMITISVLVPENLLNKDENVDRTYCILRNHNGEVSILDASYDAVSHTLTFQTNLFSDYAIGYQDTKKESEPTPSVTPEVTPGAEPSVTPEVTPGANPSVAPDSISGNGGSQGTGSGSSQGTSSTQTPKTGDTTNTSGYVLALLLSLIAASGILLKKKKTEK